VIATSKEAVELVTQVRPQSQMAESYRALRTSLLLSNLGAPPKVIMITSALPRKERRPPASIALSCWRQKGIRVLLIDADLRRPSIHKTLGMGPRSGLSNVLTGSATLQQTITRPPSCPTCLCWPAGTPRRIQLNSWLPPTCAMSWRNCEAVRSHRCGHASHSLGHRCRSAVAARRCHRIVIRSGQTTKQALRRSRDVLLQVNAKVSGVLLNAVD